MKTIKVVLPKMCPSKMLIPTIKAVPEEKSKVIQMITFS